MKSVRAEAHGEADAPADDLPLPVDTAAVVRLRPGADLAGDPLAVVVGDLALPGLPADFADHVML